MSSVRTLGLDATPLHRAPDLLREAGRTAWRWVIGAVVLGGASAVAMVDPSTWRALIGGPGILALAVLLLGVGVVRLANRTHHPRVARLGATRQDRREQASAVSRAPGPRADVHLVW